ncbi:MAG: N-methyl-D-aspartate receptor NMDAR2C subunit [Limnohabitans sp.]|nr:N-methyl-D-aspartate receptor NMDAR2C subunit [Limnohabitans sp.]
MDDLRQSWDRWWSVLGADGQGLALMTELIAAYEEPWRRYHTVQHLKECLAHLDRYSHLAQRPGEVEAAIWFHDAVYSVRAKDNEAQSAAWAGRALKIAGVNHEAIARIQSHIEATSHSAAPQGADQQLLVDMDLSILASDDIRFAEYEAQVREEYSWVPAFIYKKKRREVLQSFLSRQAIYGTPDVKLALESRARANLQASLRK